jgi:hypothetical protein
LVDGTLGNLDRGIVDRFGSLGCPFEEFGGSPAEFDERDHYYFDERDHYYQAKAHGPSRPALRQALSRKSANRKVKVL